LGGSFRFGGFLENPFKPVGVHTPDSSSPKTVLPATFCGLHTIFFFSGVFFDWSLLDHLSHFSGTFVRLDFFFTAVSKGRVFCWDPAGVVFPLGPRPFLGTS